jgi:hypothetical protein
VEFCSCDDWKIIKDQNRTLFVWDDKYGWVIRWIELVKEKAHSSVNVYGIKINFCPMCGKKLCGVT